MTRTRRLRVSDLVWWCVAGVFAGLCSIAVSAHACDCGTPSWRLHLSELTAPESAADHWKLWPARIDIDLNTDPGVLRVYTLEEAPYFEETHVELGTAFVLAPGILCAGQER